jgi:hypothetical protein
MHDSNKVDRETTHMKISAEGPAGPAGESEFLPFFNGPPQGLCRQSPHVVNDGTTFSFVEPEWILPTCTFRV